MTLYKLSPDQARDLARKFGKNGDVETQALIDSMNGDVSRMEGMVGELDAGVKGMDWAGRRSTKFDNMWVAEFKPAMERMARSIGEFTPLLRKMQASLKEAELAMNQHAADTEAIDGVL
jgi:uncharacterized protein YukE